MNIIQRTLNWWQDRCESKELEKNRANAPTTLDDAVNELILGMSLEELAAFAKENPDHPGSSRHFGHGMWLRNNWDLWNRETPTDLVKWFRSNGLWHADDFSAIIYKALYCRLTNTPFDIKAEAAYYERFWRESACLGFDGVEIPGCKRPTGSCMKINNATGERTTEYCYD